MDLTKKTFINYIAFLDPDSKISIQFAHATQKILLVAEKVAILAKYLNCANVCSKKLDVKLCEHFDINTHAINLEPGK